jgi:Ca2+-binding EF-hand superfamily protein
LLMEPDESWEHWHERAFRFFDLDGDGKLSPEEAAAFHTGTSNRTEEAAIAEKGGTPQQEEELEFPVVKRTVTVPE